MKILIYTDIHYGQFSSLIRGKGKRYTDRIENCIQSISWAEELAKERGCGMIVCGGDFFDRAELVSEEITSINDIEFNFDIPHYMLVGNHEMGIHDLSCSTTHIFGCLGFNVIDKPYSLSLDIQDGGGDIFFLPYILESDRKPLPEYLETYKVSNPIIFSHNDIKNIDMGHGIISSSGFDINEIEENSRIFINGHLHNGGQITDKVINLGNLTGNGFGEDAFTYKHNVMILDTTTLTYELIENPYAFKFYKIDFTKKNSHKYINEIANSIGNNAVVSIACKEDDAEGIRMKFDPNYHSKSPDNVKGVLYSRIQVIRNMVSDTTQNITIEEINTVDHIERFKTHILSTIGSDSIVNEELIEISG